MSDTEARPNVDDLIHDTGGEPVSGHDAFVRDRIQKRLAKKDAGTAVYHDLDEVAAEFGFDAR